MYVACIYTYNTRHNVYTHTAYNNRHNYTEYTHYNTYDAYTYDTHIGLLGLREGLGNVP
jgi:hypothetical protein